MNGPVLKGPLEQECISSEGIIHEELEKEGGKEIKKPDICSHLVLVSSFPFAFPIGLKQRWWLRSKDVRDGD